MRKPYIIAEIGFNHAGDLKLACEMIEAAAESGADAVKFQTFRAKDILLPSSPAYQGLRAAEMDLEQHRRLAETARGKGVDFLSTPFSTWAVELLQSLDVPAWKIASMDCTNRHLLAAVAKTGKPVYLSTGMATLAEIASSIDFLARNESGPVTVLHCLSLYPADARSLNLSVIPRLAELLGVDAGYSDHYPGYRACLAAAMLGATVIETHFTLDPAQEGGDHVHSASPEDLRALVREIELFREMTGDPGTIHEPPDRGYAAQYRRGLYAARDIEPGEVLSEENVLMCRPASALGPNDFERLAGRSVKRPLAAHQAVTDV